jgi:GTPase Era involved in 16S rRNA processing
VKVQKSEVKEGKIDKLLAKRSKQQEVETKEQAADYSKSIPASASKIKKTDELLTHKKPATPGAATSLF